MANRTKNQTSNKMQGDTNKADCSSKGKQIEYKPLVVHSAVYMTTYNKKYINRKKWVKPDPNHIVSFIPGTINKVYIKGGQVVKKDDPLLILDAMKMENTVFAPHDGKIKTVNIKEGDVLPKGFLMIEFER